jgi:hypothetical protein
LPLPERNIEADAWWESEWKTLPRDRTELKSVVAREFNFQFSGNPEELLQSLSDHGWQEAEPANWRWTILSMNPEATELTLPPLKRDYLGHADTLLLHRLGGDPASQETVRIWDSGVRLLPGGRSLYLGQFANEKLVQRLKVFSYWREEPASDTDLKTWKEEVSGLQARWADDSMLLLRSPAVQ